VSQAVILSLVMIRRQCPEWIPLIVAGVAGVGCYAEPARARVHGVSQIVEEDGALAYVDPNGVETRYYWGSSPSGTSTPAILESIIRTMRDQFAKRIRPQYYTIDRVTRDDTPTQSYTCVSTRLW